MAACMTAQNLTRAQNWRHANGRQGIVAMHGSKPIPLGTLNGIIEGSGLAPDAFRCSKWRFGGEGAGAGPILHHLQGCSAASQSRRDCVLQPSEPRATLGKRVR